MMKERHLYSRDARSLYLSQLDSPGREHSHGQDGEAMLEEPTYSKTQIKGLDPPEFGCCGVQTNQIPNEGNLRTCQVRRRLSADRILEKGEMKGTQNKKHQLNLASPKP